MAGGHAAAFLHREPAEELAGDDAEVHVRAAVHFRPGDGHGGVAAFGEQRGPGANLRRIGGELHLMKEVVR